MVFPSQLGDAAFADLVARRGKGQCRRGEVSEIRAGFYQSDTIVALGTGALGRVVPGVPVPLCRAFANLPLAETLKQNIAKARRGVGREGGGGRRRPMSHRVILT